MIFFRACKIETPFMVISKNRHEFILFRIFTRIYLFFSYESFALCYVILFSIHFTDKHPSLTVMWNTPWVVHPIPQPRDGEWKTKCVFFCFIYAMKLQQRWERTRSTVNVIERTWQCCVVFNWHRVSITIVNSEHELFNIIISLQWVFATLCVSKNFNETC